MVFSKEVAYTSEMKKKQVKISIFHQNESMWMFCIVRTSF